MLDSRMLAFIGVAAILTITPGADTMLVIRNVLARGLRAGLVTMLGICSGLFVHATLSALGLSLILVQSADLFEWVKLVGAGYLVVLGAQSLLQSRRVADPHPSRIVTTDKFSDEQSLSVATMRDPLPVRERGKGFRNSYAEGVLSNVLNPKVAIFYLAFLPQFIAPTDPVFAKSFLLTGIHLLMGIVWLSAIALFIGKMAQIVSQSDLRRKMDLISGAIMIALGVRLALEKR